jgi:hypothetical protein
MNPAEFIVKWARVELAERAASQEHFLDLCRLLGQPTPAEHDATGAEFTFEKYTPVTGGASAGAAGDHGFAESRPCGCSIVIMSDFSAPTGPRNVATGGATPFSASRNPWKRSFVNTSAPTGRRNCRAAR